MAREVLRTPPVAPQLDGESGDAALEQRDTDSDADGYSEDVPRDLH